MSSPDVNRNIPQPGRPVAELNSLTTVVTLLKQGMESLAGYRTGPLDRAVTFNDLISLGLISAVVVGSDGGKVSYATSADLAALIAGPTAYAARPSSPTNRQLAVFTDSTVNAWGAAVAGGGAFTVLAWYNGASWTVIGA